MNKKVIVFAGTNEGREICEYLCKNQVPTTACVATDYGSFCVENIAGLEVREGRLEEAEIQALISGYDYVVDASHPYAQVISKNIENAYGKCEGTTIQKIRIVRDSQEEKGQIFEDFDSLCSFLNLKEGNVLVTTGSKDLAHFQKVVDYKNRIFPRILPAMDSLEHALKLEFKPSHIICMQGPFSVEMNVAMLHRIKAKYMVSKDTGRGGGFAEKYEAAQLAGVSLLTIGRPTQEEGMNIQEAKTYFQKVLELRGAQYED
ncbi:MAG: precorrin-6A reductase [Eubacteriales bacterium]